MANAQSTVFTDNDDAFHFTQEHRDLVLAQPVSSSAHASDNEPSFADDDTKHTHDESLLFGYSSHEVFSLHDTTFLKSPGSGGGSLSNAVGGGVLSKYVSGDAGGYNIEILFKGTWTSALQQAFVDASERLSDIIEGDVANVFYRGKLIDDIQIEASLQSIDGVGGILGQAGPTALRTSGYLPATATMQFDKADANALNTAGQWKDVILHEMIHSVGFGSIWNYLHLLSGAGTANPLFTGQNAITAYQQLYHPANAAAGVPVEQDGGPGTRDSHWDEQTFANELMTGYLNAGQNPLSIMTVASLQDLGYNTTWA